MVLYKNYEIETPPMLLSVTVDYNRQQKEVDEILSAEIWQNGQKVADIAPLLHNLDIFEEMVDKVFTDEYWALLADNEEYEMQCF